MQKTELKLQSKHLQNCKLFDEAVELDNEFKKYISEDDNIIPWLCNDENKDKAQEVRDKINKIIAPERLEECN